MYYFNTLLLILLTKFDKSVKITQTNYLFAKKYNLNTHLKIVND